MSRARENARICPVRSIQFCDPDRLPTVSIAITTEPSNSIFMEGDTDDTITVDVTDTSETVALDNSVVLTVTLARRPYGHRHDGYRGGWICTVGTLTCTTTGTRRRRERFGH